MTVKELRARIRRGERVQAVLFGQRPEVIVELCVGRGALSPDARSQCLEELLFHRVKYPARFEILQLEDVAMKGLPEADIARVRGLITGPPAKSYYARCARLLGAIHRLENGHAESIALRRAIARVAQVLDPKLPPSRVSASPLLVRVLLENLRAPDEPGWVVDIAVGSGASDDERLGREFLDSARAGMRSAINWLGGRPAVNTLDPDAPISLLPDRWIPDDYIDHGSCFLPFAIASAFHLCGLQLPASVGLTGAESGGRVVAITGANAKCSAAREDRMRIVYAVAVESLIPMPEIETVKVETAPVHEVVSGLTRCIGDRLAEFAAPALMRHLPPPFVTAGVGARLHDPSPLPATLVTDHEAINVDLNTVWALDRSCWIGIIDKGPNAEKLLLDFLALETFVYECSRKFRRQPAVPARWWFTLPNLRSAQLGDIDMVLNAAEQEWRRQFSEIEKDLTPMELLRRFDLGRSVVRGVILSLRGANDAAVRISRLFETLGSDGLAVVASFESAEGSSSALAAELRRCLPGIRVEVASLRDGSDMVSAPPQDAPGRLDADFNDWHALLEHRPSEIMLDTILGRYGSVDTEFWTRAVFGFCTASEWRENGTSVPDQVHNVMACRKDRELTWFGRD